jgi:transcriptional regulator with XRE-family HTH domain
MSSGNQSSQIVAEVSNAALMHLGKMLRGIRTSKKWTGESAARAANLSQSTISKIENGKYGLPDWMMVLNLLRALGADDEQISQVQRQHQIAELDPTSYAFMLQSGVEGRQAQIAELEKSSRLIRDYQNSVMPGLLQTYEYSCRVFRILGHSQENAERAAGARVRRQMVLNDPTKSFVFVINDAVCYSKHGASESEHWNQLNVLITRAKKGNVRVHVLNSRIGFPVSASNPFCLIDRRYVSAETTVRELTSTINAEIRQYEIAFRALLEAALSPQDSIDFLHEAAECFRP